MAAREAACRAMEARKTALVEASWCRILRAYRIHKKEAEAILLEAEKNAGEASEAAKTIWVIMYDKPDCPRKRCQIETSSIDGGRSTTHTVTASFETAFDVDKEVTAAVKFAFVRLEMAAAEQALSVGSDYGYHKKTKKGENTEWGSRDKALVKHVPRLEKEKMKANSEEEIGNMKKSEMVHLRTKGEEGGLDQILGKHKSRIEREKMVSAQQPVSVIKPWLHARKRGKES